MGSDRKDHNTLPHTDGNIGDPMINADKANISSLKTAIAVQARLVAELRKTVDELKANKKRADRHSTV